MYEKERLFHIEKWMREKENLLYRPLGPVDFTYSPSDNWLSLEDAGLLPYEAIQPRTEWGKTWQYGWFKAVVQLPREAAGKRVELRLNLGSETTVYVNGKLAGAIDLQHKTITLAREAVPGDIYEIVAEAYAGHDRDLPVYQQSRIAVLNEELYQFFIDLEALYQLRTGIGSAPLRASEIDKAFDRLITELDWSRSGDELEATARQGREVLEPLLACVNGSTAPKLFMMGQSHLDIAWLWPIEETKRKIARTLSNQLALLEEYPEYKYVQSQPYLTHLTKELYPELYERIKRYVAEGRIIMEGGMWVEPDANIPSGESFVRQFLYGKAFLREEFGVDSRMLWLPDVFGYSGNLPQIMQKCGVDYFASVKMFQTYDNVGDTFPHNTFTWEGIDGSTVPVHLLDYGPYPNPADVSYALFQWNERVQKYGISTRLVQFGYGDGGGGANRNDLEFLRRMKDLEGVPRTAISSPIDYFEDLEQRGMPANRYVGELYYSAHRGTFTSQAKMKQGNRSAEAALKEAEHMSTLAALSGRTPYPKAQLDAAWKELLLLQFHDILPGTSIRRVHEEAEKAYEALLESIAEISHSAAKAIMDAERADSSIRTNESVTLFNVLPWDRTKITELPDEFSGATDSLGRMLPVQSDGGKLYVRAELPASGYISLESAAGLSVNAGSAAQTSSVQAAADRLENDQLLVTFNDRGEIIRIWDKESQSEWTHGISNRFRMFRDQTSSYDAWELDRRYRDAEMALPEPAHITVTGNGPLFAEIRIERKLNESTLIQTVRLHADSRRVEFHTSIDWKESHKLLKVGFDVNLHTTEALHEIQFGHVKRPNHYSRPHDADRYEVSQHRWSAFVEGDRCFALLNDCKYGINTLGKEMNLTLLRSPDYPDGLADQGMHTFTYSFHVWNKGFASNPVIREAAELNAPVLSMPGNSGIFRGLVLAGKANIIVDTVKMAEDGSGAIIARLYECKGMSTSSSITSSFGFTDIRETDMLEGLETAAGDVAAGIKPLAFDASANEATLHFTPFEVKTIRITPA
ncbi:alpha-mannosidase [Paenibacillus radicis (ex Gao et al. 2016)]|uniref:Alpha-mannosidase n=1 Tax=Paenibacillus radicis (ex Gao et al. 2016) TaxID=1737354 RepID=A0A917GYG4_9BACL|nr:glycoside hydrolase family 38 C-terminal domain-containing protein [Paenibacillus radicis (ex Gao et al. 2016)]GGG61378.1 alpha-mannosidase [Paenibacillus radicis (ex Gao et al. 2016)]